MGHEGLCLGGDQVCIWYSPIEFIDSTNVSVITNSRTLSSCVSDIIKSFQKFLYITHLNSCLFVTISFIVSATKARHMI